jgi:hypothetical protein
VVSGLRLLLRQLIIEVKGHSLLALTRRQADHHLSQVPYRNHVDALKPNACQRHTGGQREAKIGPLLGAYQQPQMVQLGSLRIQNARQAGLSNDPALISSGQLLGTDVEFPWTGIGERMGN